MTIAITTAELLDAIAHANTAQGVDGAKTTRELVDETGVSMHAIREALRQCEKEGRLRVHRVLRPNLGGGRTWVAAFTILPRKKAKRRAA